MSFPYQLRSEAEYYAAYARSLDDPEGFWKDVAKHFFWKNFPTRILDWKPSEPRVEWFADGTLNITENCLDRHLPLKGDEPAIIWEPNDPGEAGRTITYGQLFNDVVHAVEVLRAHGVGKGDRVILYMGAIPELLIAMLACARLGAIHSVVFGGFASKALADRIQDADARLVVTCDGAFRGAKEILLKPIVDEALRSCPDVSRVLVVRRTGSEVSMQEGRDIWWQDALDAVERMPRTSDAAEVMAAEDPLFILYTSGSTGKPKGVVHTTAGYMVWSAYTFVNVFQFQPGNVFFCTADPGWITGHTYVLYAPLLAGGTTLLFEGIPTWPDAGRLWDIIEKYRVVTLYTAPTAIRSLMARGLEPFKGKDLNSLKILGSVGEPINEEAWQWYHEHVGGGRCPIVDTWWQTETGGILMSSLAGITESKPAWAGRPLPGIMPVLMDEHGKELPAGEGAGNLCIKQPWPGILRTTWGDHERFRQTYFTTYPDQYFTGDGALRDELSRYRITGRVDDVLNVSGHRIGTAELENAINHHPAVVESAVVGFPHAIKGQGIWGFVVLEDGAHGEDIDTVISATVAASIGAIARPDRIQIVPGLPKTRSGKIMRRILRKIAEGETENLGDVSTLLDPGVVEMIVAGAR